MMSKYTRFLLLTFAILFSMTNLAVSAQSNTNTHTHTNLLVLKPASLDNSFKTASVCFMGFGECDPNIGFGKGDNYSSDSAEQCLKEGFTIQNCGSGQVIDGVCPYNPAYGLGCKCNPNLISCPTGQVGAGVSCGGKYASCNCSSSLVSCASNQNGVGASCGGKYESCSCKSEYQYSSSNCTSPRSVSGSSCGSKYTGCSCPSGVSPGIHGCAEYYPSPCSSVCKKAKTDNCDARTSVNAPYGCMTYWSDCDSKCQTAYTDNCRSRDAVTCSFGCASNWGDCSSKCQTCKGDPCENRTAASCTYGCQSNWSDCSSKCQTCKANPCDSVTAVSVPANASCSGYHSTCSSKCSSWACNSGYNKSGNTCTKPCQDKVMKVVVYAGDSCGGLTFSGTTESKYCDGRTETGTIGCNERCSENDFNEPYGNSGGNDSETIVRNLTKVTLNGLSSNVKYLKSYTHGTIIPASNGTIAFTTDDIQGGKDYWTLHCDSASSPIVPLAYVKEVYNILGSPRESEFYPIFAAQKNTRLYTSHSSPEHYGVTTSGADYSLKGTNDTTTLILYYTPTPSAGVPGGGGGVAYCTTSSITKNGSSVLFNNDSYEHIARSVNESEMTVVITYNCSMS